MPQPVGQKAIDPPPDLREDAIYFHSGTVQVSVEVTAQQRKTPLGDLVLRGLIDGKDIEVVFPGRRRALAVPLLQRLQAKVQLLRIDGAGKSTETSAARLKLKVDGMWRVRLTNAHDPVPERRFQLVAARWRYRGSDGVEHVYGHLPSV